MYVCVCLRFRTHLADEGEREHAEPPDFAGLHPQPPLLLRQPARQSLSGDGQKVGAAQNSRFRIDLRGLVQRLR